MTWAGWTKGNRQAMIAAGLKQGKTERQTAVDDLCGVLDQAFSDWYGLDPSKDHAVRQDKFLQLFNVMFETACQVYSNKRQSESTGAAYGNSAILALPANQDEINEAVISIVTTLQSNRFKYAARQPFSHYFMKTLKLRMKSAQSKAFFQSIQPWPEQLAERIKHTIREIEAETGQRVTTRSEDLKTLCDRYKDKFSESTGYQTIGRHDMQAFIERRQMRILSLDYVPNDEGKIWDIADERQMLPFVEMEQTDLYEQFVESVKKEIAAHPNVRTREIMHDLLQIGLNAASGHAVSIRDSDIAAKHHVSKAYVSKLKNSVLRDLIDRCRNKTTFSSNKD